MSNQIANIIAYPGTYVVQVLKASKGKDHINMGQDKNKRILCGTVISVGDEVQSKFGGILKPVLAVGDILYFLSYEGAYDLIKDDLYAVLFDDARAYEKGGK